MDKVLLRSIAPSIGLREREAQPRDATTTTTTAQVCAFMWYDGVGDRTSRRGQLGQPPTREGGRRGISYTSRI